MTNYSNQVTYGRKIVKNKKSDYYKRLFISWGVCFLVGLIIGGLLFWGISFLFTVEAAEPIETSTPTLVEVIITETTETTPVVEVGFIPLDVPMDEEMQEFIYSLCIGYNIDFPFVMALIEHESSFNEDVVSGSDDYGLMQINSINHEWLGEELGVTDFLDPHQNVKAGTYILADLFGKYEDPSMVLMAYNMGEGGASEFWEMGIFESDYSMHIMETYAEYEQQINERR